MVRRALFTEQADGFHEPATGETYPARLEQMPRELLLSLSEVDIPIYNLGNNSAFFSKTWFVSQLKPGVVILHDCKLHHFFEGIYREQLGDKQQYLALMREYHGPVGVEAGESYWRQEVGIDFMAEHFPMTAWALCNALAVIVHSPHALETVQRETRTPVLLEDLPYDAHASPERAQPVGATIRREDFFAGTSGADRYFRISQHQPPRHQISRSTGFHGGAPVL